MILDRSCDPSNSSINYLDKHSDQVSWQVSQKSNLLSVNKDNPYLSSVTLF
jgi:hypothetical protein